MSTRIARRKLTAAHRLVTDVCQLGNDAERWTDCLMAGLRDLFDARFVAIALAPLPRRPDEWVRAEIALQRGLNQQEAEIWRRGYWAEGNAFKSEFLRRSVAIASHFVTVRRQDVMTDDEWYSSAVAREIHQAIGIDAQMESHFVAMSIRRIFGMAVHREWGKPQYTVSERRDFRRVHLELARAWRQRIVTPVGEDPLIEGLPERLRQVLWLLCAGRSEKEIASELDLSPRTVHNHVTRLYDTLEVHSRGELLARALTRTRSAAVELPDAKSNEFTSP
ncbi:MAG: response regulator transcription factor [Planctomycetaceae bacterium]|nr:response regulator transcription factor [Planctomycetaceae bacterium]